MSDEKKDMDEAGWKNAAMASHASSDAWKDAQKLSNKPAGATAAKPSPWKKEPEQSFELDPSLSKEPPLKLASEMGAGGIAGFQMPLSDEERERAVRELIKHKVKEVVRKKAGGGGYALYAPNKGKKGKPKPVGTFPTKLGAKRAELSRYPPKEPGKLGRLRKEVDKLIKNPKKAAEKEKAARKQKGTDKSSKKEGAVRLPDGSGFFTATIGEAGSTPFTPTTSKPMSPAGGSQASTGQLSPTAVDFFKKLPTLKDPGAMSKFVMGHMQDDSKSGFLQSKLMPHVKAMGDKKFPGNQASSKSFVDQTMKKLHSLAQGQAKVGDKAQASENAVRRHAFMERVVLSKIITRSLTESLFREEKTESEWDDYISKLSKNALAGDNKFQSLQRNISKKTKDILEDSFNNIRKAVAKDVKLKSFGIKHDASSGQTYLAFSASFDDITAEPIYIHVEGGVPKIDLSTPAKVALTKADPSAGKLFRAELVTVQERVLDEMDDLHNAIQARDKYLGKLENEVDGYVAGLSPLQVSLLKQLLVKKYRKIS